MKTSPSPSAVRGQLIGVILMSVGLGALLITAFEQWMRSQSFVFWLGLSALFVAAICANAIALMKRIG